MSQPIFQINVSLHKKYYVCVCIHEYVCGEGDWQFQQMCSMRWQHDIYFACSIWHVWMLPCILSWCEVIARDVQPRWNHSMLSLLHQYQSISLTNRGKQQNWCTEMPWQSFYFSFYSLINGPLINWMRELVYQKLNVHPFLFCQNLKLWHPPLHWLSIN